jgi:hypothetical protein
MRNRSEEIAMSLFEKTASYKIDGINHNVSVVMSYDKLNHDHITNTLINIISLNLIDHRAHLSSISSILTKCNDAKTIQYFVRGVQQSRYPLVIGENHTMTFLRKLLDNLDSNIAKQSIYIVLVAMQYLNNELDHPPKLCLFLRLLIENYEKTARFWRSGGGPTNQVQTVRSNYGRVIDYLASHTSAETVLPEQWRALMELHRSV